ncbi:hypothetical protein B0H63DRAFT_177591 [Podospora didyma]|uniref:Uncharacterized protein n=1 Tax=Podospora didyma TaxID=330526 RepID=A0AAE0TZD0_9PEZI|nr:hypothetical protein B0H63DRAFT_177591 [Podospora didyma]
MKGRLIVVPISQRPKTMTEHLSRPVHWPATERPGCPEKGRLLPLSINIKHDGGIFRSTWYFPSLLFVGRYLTLARRSHVPSLAGQAARLQNKMDGYGPPTLRSSEQWLKADDFRARPFMVNCMAKICVDHLKFGMAPEESAHFAEGSNAQNRFRRAHACRSFPPTGAGESAVVRIKSCARFSRNLKHLATSSTPRHLGITQNRTSLPLLV